MKYVGWLFVVIVDGMSEISIKNLWIIHLMGRKTYSVNNTIIFLAFVYTNIEKKTLSIGKITGHCGKVDKYFFFHRYLGIFWKRKFKILRNFSNRMFKKENNSEFEKKILFVDFKMNKNTRSGPKRCIF